MNMQLSLYVNISQPIISGNMHKQCDKCAYVRNHGHNIMGCGHAPHGEACPHKGIPFHFQTYLFSMVGTVDSLLVLSIYCNCSL